MKNDLIFYTEIMISICEKEDMSTLRDITLRVEFYEGENIETGHQEVYLMSNYDTEKGEHLNKRRISRTTFNNLCNYFEFDEKIRDKYYIIASRYLVVTPEMMKNNDFHNKLIFEYWDSYLDHVVEAELAKKDREFSYNETYCKWLENYAYQLFELSDLFHDENLHVNLVEGVNMMNDLTLLTEEELKKLVCLDINRFVEKRTKTADSLGINEIDTAFAYLE